MNASLSLQQSPAFSVPARFLVSAPLFSLSAALLMLYYGPQMISDRWTPELLAVTHLLTLGFFAMSMFGAMLQLIPVLMGVVIPQAVFFSRIIYAALFIGCISLASGWLTHTPLLFIIALISLGVSFCIFLLLASERLLRSKSRHATRSMMLLALFALLVTAGLGIYLALAYTDQGFTLARLLTDLHLSWGLFGWVLLLIIAVAYQVIPMFQITDEYPALHQRWLGWLVFAILLKLTATYVWPLGILKTVASTLLAICMLVFALTTLWLLHRRRRQLPDLTLNFWRLAMLSLGLLALIWLVATVFTIQLPTLFTGVLFVHGFAMTTVSGMMYKIVPFLIWLHLSTQNKNLRDQGAREAQVKVPHMRKIIPEVPGQWQFRLHLASLLLLLAATLWPLWFFYPAALLFAIAQAALLFNLLKAAGFYRQTIAELARH